MKAFYSLFLLFLIFCLSGCNGFTGKTDWRMQMESQYKSPYGTYVFREELADNLFPEAYVATIKGDTKHLFDSICYSKKSASYLYINDETYFDRVLAENIKFFAVNNNSFIASWNFSTFNTDSFHIGLNDIRDSISTVYLTLLNIDSTIKTFAIKTRKETLFYFDSLPTNAEVLGYLSYKGKIYPNFIKIPSPNLNRGLFLHSQPQFFTNYYLLKENDYKYAFDVMAYLSQTSIIYWDGYRTRARYFHQTSDGSTLGALRFIWQQPALKWALVLFFSAFVLFLIFNYKRVRQSSPIFKKSENNTLAFIKTVAVLFMYEKNNSDLVKIKINFLLDKIRSNYFLNTEELNDSFIEKLVVKSLVDRNTVIDLVYQINELKSQDMVTKKEFYTLNKTIESFTTKSNLYDRH